MQQTPLSKAKNALWAVLLLTLPFTSFPLLSRLFGGTSVAPLSLLPLGFLMLFFIIPLIFKQRSIPSQSVPLILFILIALIASALAVFIFIPSFRAIPIWKNALEGVVTLIFGLSFYLVVLFLNKNEHDISRTFYWINLGGIIIIVAALIQAASWMLTGSYPQVLQNLQKLLTSNGILFLRRVNAVAYEPSWLAHQLNLLYLPIWLGFTLKRQSTYKLRILKVFTVENLLLVLGVVVLFLSFSRIGWLTSLIVFGFVAIQAINRRLFKKKTARPLIDFFIRFAAWTGILLAFIFVVVLVGLLLTKIDPRMAQLFDLQRLADTGVIGWASQLSFAERIIYWQAAFNVFLQHPIFGVGLGGAGYFFPISLPSFGYMLPEIIRAFTVDTFIPNAKNLWVRLLAETGIIGFVFFVAWIANLWREAKAIESVHIRPNLAVVGMVGQIGIVALILEGFSMDTFGLPYYWIMFGLISATSRLLAREQ